jgi:type III secretory pathway component EscT
VTIGGAELLALLGIVASIGFMLGAIATAAFYAMDKRSRG